MKYRINYTKVISQANEIFDEADRLYVQIKQLLQIEQECRIAWKGQAADVFISKINTLRNEMSRTASQMSDLASTIEYCANKIQREDQEAEHRAAALKTGH